MPHESAVAELELADAYLELNLAAEAAAIYEQVTATFGELGMRAEQARALLNYGRASVRLGRIDEAWSLLAEAGELFRAEANPIGAAMVDLAEAALHYREGDYPSAVAVARRAERPLRAASAWGQLLALCWLAGDAARGAGDLDEARRLLEATLRDAEQAGVIQVAQRCHTSLGRLAAQAGDRAGAELNWLYGRTSRPTEGAADGLNTLDREIRAREDAVAELRRRMREGGALSQSQSFDLPALPVELGAHSAIVEYVAVGDTLVAFVITGSSVQVVRGIGPLAAVERELGWLHFQLAAFKYGAVRARAHLATQKARATVHLATLYDLLLRPIAGLLGDRRLVVVPHGALHYVPFHALHDGEGYCVARREVCCTPSASVLQHCLALPRAPLRRALILGVADEQAPQARGEAWALAPLFPSAETLLDQEATAAALAAAAPRADLLHLACHGRFRPDNPLFSALRLADGWLTVHDVYSLDLRCQLVVLSACETGMSAVAPGDELLGLARGFFMAGAPSLLVSQWSVDDAATAELMVTFYRLLQEGATPSAALRRAQLAAMERRPHPFFWASFTLLGRW